MILINVVPIDWLRRQLDEPVETMAVEPLMLLFHTIESHFTGRGDISNDLWKADSLPEPQPQQESIVSAAALMVVMVIVIGVIYIPTK